MSLPGGRPIVVDGKNYHWICKQASQPFRYEKDDYGDDRPVYGTVVTFVSDEGGPVVQHAMGQSSVTPELVAQMIRIDVGRHVLGTRDT
jgi:hypothetical protein